MEGSFKAAKGLIKIKARIESGDIKEIQISGDFFMYPEDKLWELEQLLIGIKASREKILSKVKGFYKRTALITPGVNPEDFTEAIIRAVGCSVES